MSKLKLVAYLVSILSMSGFVVGVLALLDIVPLRYVWGGRLTDKSQLMPMEAITLIVNAFIIWAVGMRAGYLSLKLKQSSLSKIMLSLAIVMALNTAGNLVAKTNVEKYFAILTLISTFCFIYLYKIKTK